MVIDAGEDGADVRVELRIGARLGHAAQVEQSFRHLSSYIQRWSTRSVRACSTTSASP